jgi:sterol desaturase/sphingolipid hydroxylase (fatty acid hydroxylase superfamily)
MLDTDQLRGLYNKLWVFFVDHHLLAQPSLILLGGLSLMVIEVLLRDWHKTAMYRLFVRRSISAKIDVISYLLQYVGIAVILETVLTFGISIGAARLADVASDRLSWARITLPSDGILQIGFSFAVYWLAFHFVGYWVHRVWHTPLFWNVHRLHHSASEMNFITVLRIHPAETLVRILFFISPMTILHVSDSVLLLSLTANTFVNFCLHSDLDWNLGWVGRWIVGTPAVHRLHHSIDDEHRNKNFSNCPLWDRMFGTWYDGEKQPSGYGVSANGAPDRGYDQQPIRQLVLDTVAFYRQLAAWLLQPFRKAISGTRTSSNSDTALAGTVAAPHSVEERIGA